MRVPQVTTAAVAAAALVAEERGLEVTTADLAAVLAAGAAHLAIPARTRSNEVIGRPYHAMLESLMAEGWPKRHIGLQMGRAHAGSVMRIMRHPSIRRETAELIAAVYERLHGQDPLEHGVTQKGVTGARNYAASRRWRVLPRRHPRAGVDAA